jgi:hypothetical protein
MNEPNACLPDDPAALKAMLAAREAEIDRLRQIIKELQRHRFGRRAESLPIDQLLLGLEEAEQAEAEGLLAKRSPTTRSKKLTPGSGAPTAVRCPPICRASSRSSTSSTRSARVAAVRCTSWARTRPSGST